MRMHNTSDFHTGDVPPAPGCQNISLASKHTNLLMRPSAISTAVRGCGDDDDDD
jgi:hypothetical protein